MNLQSELAEVQYSARIPSTEQLFNALRMLDAVNHRIEVLFDSNSVELKAMHSTGRACCLVQFESVEVVCTNQVKAHRHADRRGAPLACESRRALGIQLDLGDVRQKLGPKLLRSKAPARLVMRSDGLIIIFEDPKVESNEVREYMYLPASSDDRGDEFVACAQERLAPVGYHASCSWDILASQLEYALTLFSNEGHERLMVRLFPDRQLVKFSCSSACGEHEINCQSIGDKDFCMVARMSESAVQDYFIPHLLSHTSEILRIAHVVRMSLTDDHVLIIEARKDNVSFSVRFAPLSNL